MGWFLANIKTIAAVALTVVVALGLHWFLSWRAEESHKAAMLTQKAQLIQECEDQKKLTKEITDDLLQKNKTLSGRVADFYRRSRLQPPASCIPIQGRPASSGLGATGNQGLLGGSGISAEWLADFARRCEVEALKLDSLQEWIARTSPAAP